MKKVKIIDAIMGSGKTYNAIEGMKKSKRNFLYVTPFLEEVKRIKDNVPGTKEPKVRTRYNYRGETDTLFKRDHLLEMTNYHNNIATTHSLFSSLHKDDYKHFHNYDLILDEVITPIKLIDMAPDDITIAFNEKLLVLNEITGEVSYTGDSYEGLFYRELKKYCDASNVIYINNRLLVWAFPPEIFKSFNSVTVLTYLFEGSLLANYFTYYNIPYDIVKDEEKETLKKNEIRKLLTIYEGRGNDIGLYKTAFSVNWLKNKKAVDFKKIKTTVANLLDRNFKSTSKSTAFTTFKDFAPKLKGKGYSKGFIAVNERATNKYSNKESMIYLANRYLNPNFIEFFRSGSVEVNQDNWALAELLQWLWRGQIRVGKPMNVFIPSKRMRTLLYGWLEESESCSLYEVA